MKMGDRIRERRKAAKWSQARLSEESGISQQMLSKLERGVAFGTTEIVQLARALNVTPRWLESGEGAMTADQYGQLVMSNVSPGPPITGKVPVISWVQAGTYKETVDLFEPGDAEDWIETTVPIREHTFALRIQGDSMEPNFQAGMLVVVEPDLDPQPGDYVIVKNGDEATFKQLVKDGGDWYLKPLNPRYPLKPLESTCSIVGVVREAVWRFR